MEDETGTTTYEYDENNQLLSKRKDGILQVKYTFTAFAS